MPNKFYKIPDPVFTSKSLTPADKIVYAQVARFKDECFMGKEQMAENIGLSERQVRISLARLEEAGLIAKIKRHGNFTAYRAPK